MRPASVFLSIQLSNFRTSIDKGEDYDQIYQYSVALDQLIEQYITAGF